MSYTKAQADPHGRLIAISAVAAVHLGLLASMTLNVFGPGRQEQEDALATFDVREPPPAPRPEPVERPRPPRPEGEAAPANARATPSEVTAPPPVVASPVNAPAPPVAGTGAAPSVGAAADPGPGMGAGGAGAGLGCGGAGDGTGGGGASRARLIRGAIRNSDYPKASRRARSEGTVTVQFTVGTDGRASGCRIVRPSGDPALDAVTCELIQKRYRYEPALNAAGEPVSEVRAWQQRWWLEGEAPR